MYFAIRDDDTCYFTRPDELEANYGRVWHRCPVSLAVVPFHGCTVSGALPREHWQGDAIFPIGDNADLVKFLREQIAAKRVHIVLHGYSHKSEPGGHEFVAGEDLERKVAVGKRYLEQLFNVPIRVFVPPHTALSRRGWAAVVNNGLSICGRVGLRSRKVDAAGVGYLLLRRWWRTFRKCEYPFPFRYRSHSEMECHELTPKTSLDALRRSLALCQKWNGYFCLATHYWEFPLHQTGDNSASEQTVGDVFFALWDEVAHLPDVHFVSLGDMLDARGNSLFSLSSRLYTPLAGSTALALSQLSALG